jgi:hypothetical protein
VPERRLAELLEDAAEFFASNWDTQSSDAARELLARHGLDEKVIRRFGVGFAPVGSDELMDHLRSLGYSTDEIVASGLGRQSARGHVHPHFSSRIMFPIREPDGRIVGFAGLGTHLAPSWPLWVISPDTDLYNRSEAVFGLDQAAKKIATRKSAVVVGDCIEVLKAHQDGRPHAVTVHTSGVTEEQVAEVGSVVSGGADALEIEFDGIRMESDADRSVLADRAPQVPAPREPPPHLPAKRLALIIGTALVAINTFTGAPLLAVWIGAQAQAGQVLSLRGVITVIVVLTVLEFLLGLALTWLSSTYDRLTGRPRFAGETSPWQRAKRGDRVQDIRARFGMSPPEKIVAASVIIGVFALEIWFFFFAGSSLPNQ